MARELDIRIKATSTAGVAFAKLRKQTGQMRQSLKITRPTMRGLGTAARKMGTAMAGPAVRGVRRLVGRLRQLRTEGGLTRKVIGGLGGLLRGVLTAGLFAAAGAVLGLGRAFGAMREAMEGDAGEALAAVGEQAQETTGDIEKAGRVSEAAVAKISTVFGAWGQVGEGFVQTQGRITEQAASTAAAAVDTAQESAEAMDDAKDSIGGATQATTRFGKAVDRISEAFARAKKIILQAIAKAITPALEAFADLLESPEFQEFVDLIAEDLAEAAKKVADWFINKVIPAIQDLMERIKAAGGPVKFFKQEWRKLGKTVKMIIAIIVRRVLGLSKAWRSIFANMINIVKGLWNRFTIFLVTGLARASQGATAILTALGIFITAKFLEWQAAVFTVLANITVKFLEWRDSVFTVLARIVDKALTVSNKIRDFFRNAINEIKGMWTSLKEAIITALSAASEAAQTILAGMAEIVRGAFNSVIIAVETAINALINPLNELLNLYNAVMKQLFEGFKPIKFLKKIELPRLQGGGIVARPLAAVVGDAPSPEVVAPLDDLVDILRDVLGGTGTQINVTVPAGTTDPFGFGDAVGNAIATALRRSGQRVPTI